MGRGVSLTFAYPSSSTTGFSASVICCDEFGLMIKMRTGVSAGEEEAIFLVISVVHGLLNRVAFEKRLDR